MNIILTFILSDILTFGGRLIPPSSGSTSMHCLPSAIFVPRCATPNHDIVNRDSFKTQSNNASTFFSPPHCDDVSPPLSATLSLFHLLTATLIFTYRCQFLLNAKDMHTRI